MNKQRILVISSANIDFVQRMRRMPYSGETVIENELKYSYIPGGKGANSAIAFSRFGADTVFACKLGRDANAKRLRSIYEREGIDTRYILEDEETPTGLASILVEDNGKNRIIVYPGANMTMTAEDIEESFTCYPDAVYMQLEIPDEAVIEAARRANEAEIPLFIDAGPARLDFPLDKLGKIEIFSPNESECRIFTGITPNSEENCLRAAIRLSSLVDAKYIVIKLGDKGAFIYDGREYYMIPSEKVEAVDTTAAGDIFTAVMTYVYLQNHNIVSAVKYATCAAAISVTREGASTSIPTREEVIAYAKAKVAGDADKDNADAVVAEDNE
ncbi:MAG: ribokinase [Clostridia bacterium]|nr:ribokinase [Clostridia bacterium]MBQ8370860.1 ribokinase [Clostridia bacterium]MBQ8513678.1 ribokinase [Clostridia bacterium]